MAKAVEVADYITKKCMQDNCPISNLQLQKILYFIQRDYLQKSGRALFDDDFEAWPLGPVIPGVYKKYSIYAGNKIGVFATDKNTYNKAYDISPIYNVVVEKRELDTWKLVEETHERGKAWDLIYREGEGKGCIIPKKLIKTNG